MIQEIERKLELKKTAFKYICYTLDLEEDHAGILHDNYEGLEYLEDFIGIVREEKINLSIFVQAKIIERFSEKIELLRKNNFDIHLHSYSHSMRKPKSLKDIREDIEKGIKIYRDFFGKNPTGYRFPYGKLSNKKYIMLKELGFKFDSSIFPTLRIGFYNNLIKPLKPYRVHGIIEIPFSVISNLIRVPIALSYIKLLYPLHFLINYHYSPLIFNFHMHDLFNLRSKERIKNLKKIHYLRKSTNGLYLFLKFYKKLMNEGYKSISIYKIYKKTSN